MECEEMKVDDEGQEEEVREKMLRKGSNFSHPTLSKTERKNALSPEDLSRHDVDGRVSGWWRQVERLG